MCHDFLSNFGQKPNIPRFPFTLPVIYRRNYSLHCLMVKTELFLLSHLNSKSQRTQKRHLMTILFRHYFCVNFMLCINIDKLLLVVSSGKFSFLSDHASPKRGRTKQNKKSSTSQLWIRKTSFRDINKCHSRSLVYINI